MKESEMPISTVPMIDAVEVEVEVEDEDDEDEDEDEEAERLDRLPNVIEKVKLKRIDVDDGEKNIVGRSSEGRDL